MLLDIEGTVSDVRFVHDVMFPYARCGMVDFLETNWHLHSVQQSIEQVAADAEFGNAEAWLGKNWRNNAGDACVILHQHLEGLMENDSKSTGLKQLQGMVWQKGFESGVLRAKLFSDVVPALQRWRDSGLDIRIFSSGSVLAQKLFFQHTTEGNLLSFFSAHYDTTIGSKKERWSFEHIASDCHLDPADIVFVTDVHSEILAAELAGIQAVASVRPNNLPLPTDFTGLAVTSFDQLAIAR